MQLTGGWETISSRAPFRLRWEAFLLSKFCMPALRQYWCHPALVFPRIAYLYARAGRVKP